MWTEILDVNILAKMIDLYYVGFKNSTYHKNRRYFKPDDKKAIAKEFVTVMDKYRCCEEGWIEKYGYVSTQTIAKALAKNLHNGESWQTLQGRLNIWRAEYEPTRVWLSAAEQKAEAVLPTQEVKVEPIMCIPESAAVRNPTDVLGTLITEQEDELERLRLETLRVGNILSALRASHDFLKLVA